MWWRTVEGWKIVVPIIPVITVEGDFVWFKKCQRRKLQQRWDDGYDCLRDIRSRYQYRRFPVSAEHWPKSFPASRRGSGGG